GAVCSVRTIPAADRYIDMVWYSEPRYILTTAAVTEEASNDNSRDGAAHGSSNDGGNYTQNLDRWTRKSTIEEAFVLCVNDGGNGRGSDDGEVNDCAQSRVYGLGSGRGRGGGVCVR
ncbi:hypothetical protein BHM03_00032900, partial [Ensete ventricosum]